jgi:hypothetical protein
MLNKGIILLVIILLLGLIAACTPQTVTVVETVVVTVIVENDSFYYPVRVQAKGTSDYIPGAKITIEVAGKAPLDGFTDDNGFARVFVDPDRVGEPGVLRVEAAGYEQYTQNIDLYEEVLPDVVQLESASNDAVATLPTATPTPTDTPVPPTDTPAPTPTSEIDGIFGQFENISRLLLEKDLAAYVGTYNSETEEYLSIYSSEDWDTCSSETPSFNSNAGESIVAQIRGEWAVPDCDRNSFETRVTEDLIVLKDTQASEALYRELVAEARRAPFFKSGFEMETQYATFWVVRSDYENGTTAIMVTRVDEAVIQISIESDEIIDERNLSILTLAAVVQLTNYPLNRGVPILLDPSLFAENVGRSLAVYPIPGMRRVYDPQPTISEIIQKYGEPDRIEETRLHYASDALDDSIELDAMVYYYGGYGFGILVDQVIDQETLDYIKETYGSETYEPLISPKNGEVIWVVVEQPR